MENPPNNGECREWRNRREAKYFIEGLQAEYEAIKEDIVRGSYTTETVDGTAQLLAKAIGRAEQLTDVIDMLEEFGRTDEDEEEEK